MDAAFGGLECLAPAESLDQIGVDGNASLPTPGFQGRDHKASVGVMRRDLRNHNRLGRPIHIVLPQRQQLPEAQSS